MKKKLESLQQSSLNKKNVRIFRSMLFVYWSFVWTMSLFKLNQFPSDIIYTHSCHSLKNNDTTQVIRRYIIINYYARIYIFMYIEIYHVYNYVHMCINTIPDENSNKYSQVYVN